MNARNRIVPQEKGTAPLDVVIAVMAFLAALAIGILLITERAAFSWSAGLAGKLTVQILPMGDSPRQQLAKEAAAALVVLRATPGIARATPLSEDEQLKLVQPWLGAGDLVGDLPMPQLIDADVTPGAEVDVTALAARLKSVAPDSVLDDHSHWIGRLRGLARTLIWSAYAVLLLIAVATAATVSFATRAGLETHAEMVALLHQMGAQAGFIARAFEWHYFRTTLMAAALGAALAALAFLALGGLDFAGVESVPFLPPLALRPAEFGWFAAVPAAAGLIALATARLSVLAALKKIH